MELKKFIYPIDIFG